eukprot:scaffold1422_cov297-Prasinococcus_capsulatus_cf.AAC.9
MARMPGWLDRGLAGRVLVWLSVNAAHGAWFCAVQDMSTICAFEIVLAACLQDPNIVNICPRQCYSQCD